MYDLFLQGGAPPVMKYLLKEGLMHGDCLTCTGKTLEENLEEVDDLDWEKNKIIKPLDNPIKKDGMMRYILKHISYGFYRCMFYRISKLVLLFCLYNSDYPDEKFNAFDKW